MMPATENSAKERVMSAVQRKRQLACMNDIQKKTQAIFFVNINNSPKGIKLSGVEKDLTSMKRIVY